MRISDWSSDVCSSDLGDRRRHRPRRALHDRHRAARARASLAQRRRSMKRFWKDVQVEDGGIRLDGRPIRTPGRAPLILPTPALAGAVADEWRGVGETVRSEEHTSELTSLMSLSYAHFCLKTKTI